jgi:hypothetical protein
MDTGAVDYSMFYAVRRRHRYGKITKVISLVKKASEVKKAEKESPYHWVNGTQTRNQEIKDETELYSWLMVWRDEGIRVLTFELTYKDKYYQDTYFIDELMNEQYEVI